MNCHSVPPLDRGPVFLRCAIPALCMGPVNTTERDTGTASVSDDPGPFRYRSIPSPPRCPRRPVAYLPDS
jgi:hypothetical protein